MVVLGRTLLVVHFVFLLLAAILVVSSLVGAVIAATLGGIAAIFSAVGVLLAWAVFGGLTIRDGVRLANSVAREETGNLTEALMWANGLFITVTALSAGTGVLLGFLAFVGCGPVWLPSLYHWAGMIGTALGFLAYFSLPVIVRTCVGDTGGYATPHRWGWVVGMPLGTALVWGVVWLGVYLYLKDNVNLSEYTRTGYKLPFPGGDTSWVIQGNNTSADHSAAVLGQKFAWDFRRPCGSPLLAARSGKVIYAIHSNDGFGKDSPNNQIQVLHPDGTVAVYLHLQQGSIPGNLFPTGASTPAVTQGQQIAKVGCVGISLTGHVHFEVRLSKASPITSVPTVGVVFADVTDDNGIPRTFGAYTSGNSKVP